MFQKLCPGPADRCWPWCVANLGQLAAVDGKWKGPRTWLEEVATWMESFTLLFSLFSRSTFPAGEWPTVSCRASFRCFSALLLANKHNREPRTREKGVLNFAHGYLAYFPVPLGWWGWVCGAGGGTFANGDFIMESMLIDANDSGKWGGNYLASCASDLGEHGFALFPPPWLIEKVGSFLLLHHFLLLLQGGEHHFPPHRISKWMEQSSYWVDIVWSVSPFSLSRSCSKKFSASALLSRARSSLPFLAG